MILWRKWKIYRSRFTLHGSKLLCIFRNYWEKKPLHVSKRHSEYSVLLSTPIIDSLLHYSNIIYTKNIDITFYSDGAKELLNQEGVARPHVVWDFYQNKCSIRLLNPQTFVPNIHKLNSELQEYFGCFVGCNAYLTPPLSQGFAPHYDDIEAFILQVEGRKLWKVYEPRYISIIFYLLTWTHSMITQSWYF